MVGPSVERLKNDVGLEVGLVRLLAPRWLATASRYTRVASFSPVLVMVMSYFARFAPVAGILALFRMRWDEPMPECIVDKAHE